MQIAYSLKFGEVVAAADADYEDCAKHQLTCPECREAVFKGMRALPREMHYFSHYRATCGADECELRVSKIAHGMGAANGFVGHDQSLSRFMATFRDSIVTSYAALSGVDLHQHTLEIYSRSYLDDFEDVFVELANLFEKVDDPRTSIAKTLACMPIFSDRSPFWCRRSASYVLDALRHLKTHQVRSNRRFLVAMSFAAWPRKGIDFVDFGSERLETKNLAKRISEAGPAGAVRHLKDVALKQRAGRTAGSQPSSALREISYGKALDEMRGMSSDRRADYFLSKTFELLNRKREIEGEERKWAKKQQETLDSLLRLDLCREIYGPVLGLLCAGFEPIAPNRNLSVMDQPYEMHINGK